MGIQHFPSWSFPESLFPDWLFPNAPVTPVVSGDWTKSQAWPYVNIGTPYPFTAPLSADRELESCLVDGIIVCTGTSTPAGLELDDLDLLASPAMVSLNAAGGGAFYSSAGIVPTTSVVGDFTVYQWLDDTVNIKLVFLTSTIPSVAWPLTNVGGIFVPSAVSYQQEPVLSLTVDGSTISSGSPVFKEGYNCELSAEDTLELSFVPGSGLGRYQDCSAQTIVLRRINGQSPNDLGDLVLTGDDCVVVVPDPDNNALSIFSFCTVCCECSDYTATYAAIHKLVRQASSDVRNVLYGVSASLGLSVAEFQAIKAAREKLHLDIKIIPSYDRLVGVQANLGNTTQTTVLSGETLTLSFEFDSSADPPVTSDPEYASIVPGSGRWILPGDTYEAVDPSGSYPEYTVNTPQDLTPGGWAVYQFTVYVQGSGAAAGETIYVDADFSTAADGKNVTYLGEYVP